MFSWLNHLFPSLFKSNQPHATSRCGVVLFLLMLVIEAAPLPAEAQINDRPNDSGTFSELNRIPKEPVEGETLSRANALAGEKSPYLQQHASNPVDWFPWGEAAFSKARKENKLIFLSIGYSTCHWCHVMEEESFKDQATAELLNRHFISIKVDREERPDIDQVYMTFVQASTGSGGWPLNVWLTPDLKPFVGGTYFPPESRNGMVGFKEALLRIQSVWESDPESVTSQSSRIAEFLKSMQSDEPQNSFSEFKELATSAPEELLSILKQEWDPINGGFGTAPKFPNPAALGFLMEYESDKNPDTSKDLTPKAMLWKTLEAMLRGGIYDQLRGGFHRYSVDSAWRVPHFEKMLYDQAQLVEIYARARLQTGDPSYLRITQETLAYLEERLRSHDGGFFSAEDADSYPDEKAEEKKEGAFYVWTAQEFREALDGMDPNTVAALESTLGILPDGNAPPGTDPHGEFLQRNILYWTPLETSTADSSKTWNLPEYTQARQRLLEYRSRRPRPFRDEKIITAWNGLVISALATAGEILDAKQLLLRGEQCAEFIQRHLWNPEGKFLYRRYLNGAGSLKGMCEDYAFLIRGLIDLYEATANVKWLQWAEELQESQIRQFEDSAQGGFFNAPVNDDPNLLIRFKPLFDSAEPSSNSATFMNLMWLGWALNRPEWIEKGEKIIQWASPQLKDNPRGSPMMAQGLRWMKGSPAQIVLTGDSTSSDYTAMRKILVRRRQTGAILLHASLGENETYLKQKWENPIWQIPDLNPADGAPTGSPTETVRVYWCENFTCQAPITSPEKLQEWISNPQKSGFEH